MSDVVKFPCPTCSGPSRETVGMVCPTCGTDYGTSPAHPDRQGTREELVQAPIAHDAEPLEPFDDDRGDCLRTHEWMGMEDDSRCAACFVTIADCDGPCDESARWMPCPVCKCMCSPSEWACWRCGEGLPEESA